jgi:hypothetical protein
MNSRNDRIKVIVRSRKVLTDIVYGPVTEFRTLASQGLSPKADVCTRRLIYEQVLDDEQKEIVQHARSLANELGLELDIMDLGKQNFLHRILSRVTAHGMKLPSVLMPGDVIGALPHMGAFHTASILAKDSSPRETIQISSKLESSSAYRDECEEHESAYVHNGQVCYA